MEKVHPRTKAGLSVKEVGLHGNVGTAASVPAILPVFHPACTSIPTCFPTVGWWPERPCRTREMKMEKWDSKKEGTGK
ncbi:hypothetical protein Pcinc_008957 [Petrolisthes cinctipes]|uniref:Uncharacterized protein n=1 Tax=Petrolisthes cinctipes TaxID=88211 RepID=A0AAE1G6D2_PETCI|nr:hypothetical protein Pcinc_008957 [Petrolisthes cinctipes]